MTQTHPILIFCFSLILLSFCRPGGELEAQETIRADLSIEKLTGELDDAVQSTMKEQNVPGAGVVIVKDGKTIYKRGFGIADIEKDTAVDPDTTLFRIGSISKALTLLTITRQIDQGRLTMDDDVTKYIEGIQNPYGFKRPVTIEHLLTHTSGFDQLGGNDRQIRNFDQSLERRKADRPDLAEYLKANRLRRVSPAGAYYRYDTYGSSLAGVVLEQVTGVTYPEAMRNEMFLPLGMDSTFVEADVERISDLAIGYEVADGRKLPQPYEVYVTTPASSIDSTVADMGRLLEALTGGGGNEHGMLFGSETARAVLAPQFRPHPEFPGTTHGLHESYDASGTFEKAVFSMDHGGTMAGFSSLMSIMPRHNVGVYVVANRGFRRNRLAAIVMKTVVDNLPNVKIREPYPVPERIKTGNQTSSLAEYTGDFFYGVFSHSGTPDEFANGAWPRGEARVVSEKDGALQIGDDTYLSRGDDVFVRQDGKRMVFFGRNQANDVSHFVFSSSDDTFEREHPDRPHSIVNSLAQSLFDTVRESGIKVAIQHFTESKDAPDFYLREDEMNNVGYALLQADRTSDAIEVFKLTVKSFPESWNAHDSLGEAFAHANKNQEAIESYEKSLQLNPENIAGKEILKKLKEK